jgi:hypothetical protein
MQQQQQQRQTPPPGSGSGPRPAKLAALQTDDVVPAFLARKLEISRTLGDTTGPNSPTRKPSQGRVSDPAAELEQNSEQNTMRKKDAFLRTLFNDTKLNHRQKEHMAANILIGKADESTRGPVFSQGSPAPRSIPISPGRVGNILTDGHRQRHGYNHRSVELVGGSVDIQVASAKELRKKEVKRRHDEQTKPGGYTWANEYIPALPPYKLSAPRTFEGVQPSANREFIVDAISQHNAVKAKKNADQVRNLKATAMQEKSLFGDDLLREVSIKKKLSKFRRKLHVYLQGKGDAQRGDIMRCIDEETIYTFMENFKGYSMSPDVILSLLGASLGSNLSEGMLLLPDAATLDGSGKGVGYLPVQSSYQELNPHLRELHLDTSSTEDIAHAHPYATGFTPHTVYSPTKAAKSNTVNGFRVNPRPTSRMASGFMIKSKPKSEGECRARAVSEDDLMVTGEIFSSHATVTPRNPEEQGPPANPADPGQGETSIPRGQEKSTWVTDEFNDSFVVDSARQVDRAANPAQGQGLGQASLHLLQASTSIAEGLATATDGSGGVLTDTLDDEDGGGGGGKAPTPNLLGGVMRNHMATHSTLPSLYPEKVLTEEELLGLGNKTMTFEEIAIKKERAAIAAKKAKKPVTGLAGLKNGKGSRAPRTVSPDRTPIPRFIMTPQAGAGEAPRSPNPSVVPVEHFGDDC